ncbi:MAG: flagellar hook assembly protein FlgD [Methylococcales bacterium]
MNVNFDQIKSLGIAQTEVVEEHRTELGQSDFLKLLTTQLANQDPSNPMDNAEFMSQMAQFSTVTGIQELQKSFSEFATAMSSEQSLQASNLVGRMVLAPSDTGLLEENSGITGEMTLSEDASAITVQIQNNQGELVRTINIDAQEKGQVPFEWDGFYEDGTRAAPGVYQININGVVKGENLDLEPQIKSKVESVTLNQGSKGLKVNLHGLGSVDFNNVKQIL